MSSRSIKKRPSTKKKHPFVGVLAVLGICAVLVGAGALALSALAASWLEDLPAYEDADAFNTARPTIVYASDGQTELARFELEYRVPVEQGQISRYVLDGTVATEDERFAEHHGVDFAGIARAAVNNIAGGKLEGASTITQQFVRNTILADEMDDISIKRKVREAYLAMQLEKIYSKDQILVMYLNTINYGAGAYGIEAASQRYFSKPATELSLVEAATLIGIPQSPTYNNPIEHPDNALARRNTVLDRMLSNGVISKEEHDAAQSQPIELNVTDLPGAGLLAYPYFGSYVRSQLYNDFNLSESDILKGGLTVVTTLDVEAQKAAEAACAKKRDAMGGGSLECAMAVVEPATGYIKAIVGGSDYEANEVNLATGQGGGGRPCGSAFKIFTLVEAINQGIDPQTYVDCTSPANVDGYKLSNYDGINYGTRTIARAFAVSSNTGFVRLIASIGVKNVADMARALGVSSHLDPDTAGAALTLGVEDVTPLEMAEACATIAAGGIHRTATPVMTIVDAKGKVLVDNTDIAKRSERVISPEVAYAAEQVMKLVVETSEGTGTAARLPNGQEVAGKTGTTESYKDITFCGITPQLSVGIWCGDRENVASVPVGTNCADTFREFASAVLATHSVTPFAKAEKPAYKPYIDEKYHIYGTSYAPARSEEKTDGEGEGSHDPQSGLSDNPTGSEQGPNGESPGAEKPGPGGPNVPEPENPTKPPDPGGGEPQNPEPLNPPGQGT